MSVKSFQSSLDITPSRRNSLKIEFEALESDNTPTVSILGLPSFKPIEAKKRIVVPVSTKGMKNGLDLWGDKTNTDESGSW